jgi:hypothetical protein
MLSHGRLLQRAKYLMIRIPPYIPAITKYKRNQEQNLPTYSLDAPSVNESDYFLILCLFVENVEL